MQRNTRRYDKRRTRPYFYRAPRFGSSNTRQSAIGPYYVDGRNVKLRAYWRGSLSPDSGAPGTHVFEDYAFGLNAFGAAARALDPTTVEAKVFPAKMFIGSAATQTGVSQGMGGGNRFDGDNFLEPLYGFEHLLVYGCKVRLRVFQRLPGADATVNTEPRVRWAIWADKTSGSEDGLVLGPPTNVTTLSTFGANTLAFVSMDGNPFAPWDIAKLHQRVWRDSSYQNTTGRGGGVSHAISTYFSVPKFFGLSDERYRSMDAPADSTQQAYAMSINYDDDGALTGVELPLNTAAFHISAYSMGQQSAEAAVINLPYTTFEVEVIYYGRAYDRKSELAAQPLPT